MMSRMGRDKLNSEARRFLDEVDALSHPPLESLPPAEARAQVRENSRRSAGDLVNLARVEDLEVPGPGAPIPVRLYRDSAQSVQPCLVYFHGGGYVVGDLDTHDPVCRRIA